MYLYAWMKFVETAPERYDKGMEIMTGGLLTKIKNDIANTIPTGSKVLDIGCGTATLPIEIIKNGSMVTGLDCSSQMLDIARKNANDAGINNEQLVLINDSVTQITNLFENESFDVIVSTAALGEFPKEYLHYIFEQCYRILKPGGRLIVADEVLPENIFARILHMLVMAAVWIPQFLVVRRVCYPIMNLTKIMERSGFSILKTKKYGYNSFLLVNACKGEA